MKSCVNSQRQTNSTTASNGKEMESFRETKDEANVQDPCSKPNDKEATSKIDSLEAENENKEESGWKEGHTTGCYAHFGVLYLSLSDVTVSDHDGCCSTAWTTNTILNCLRTSPGRPSINSTYAHQCMHQLLSLLANWIKI